MVLHSLALRDVITLWVESVFILNRSEGLAVFVGVSSSVNCHLSVSLAEWALVMFCLCSMFRHPLVGCVTGRMFFPSSLAPLVFFLRVQFPVGSVQPLVAVPWGEPFCVYSHLLYSFWLTQTSTSRTVLICVVCLRFRFPHYSSLCLRDGFQYFCHGPFLVLLRVPMVRLCCLLSLGSYSWLNIFTRLHYDGVLFFYLCAHIPPSRSMLGIVIIKYSGNVRLQMLFLY